MTSLLFFVDTELAMTIESPSPTNGEVGGGHLKDHYSRNGDVSMWRLPGRLSVVWCRASPMWRRVRKWRFAHPYAVSSEDGPVVARAFVIPTPKEAFARRVLGLPTMRRQPTANQLAYYERLRARASVMPVRYDRQSALEAHHVRYFVEESGGGASTDGP